MFTLQQYAANFAPHPVPGLLAKLYEFQSELDDFFSDGFELIVEDKSALHSWSEEPEFSAALFPFARANFSGSSYALWLREGGSLEDAPVVIFGDEGGAHVVAENLAALLRILGYDQEPMVDLDEVYYFKPGDADPDEEDGGGEDEDDEDEDDDEEEDEDDEDEDDEDEDDEDEDEEAEGSGEAASYAQWLEGSLKLEPIRTAKEAKALVAAAQTAHGAAFKAWFARFAD